MIAVVIVVCVLCAVVSWAIAQPKGRGDTAALYGLFLGPVGVVIAILMRPLDTRPIAELEAEWRARPWWRRL